MSQNLYAKGDEGYMKVTKVRNQEPAPIQITAEQLVMEAQAYISEDIPAPNLNIFDAEELEDYKYKTRKTFEDQIRMQKQHMGTWRKYAKWEGILGEFERSRSIFERALEVNPYDTRVIEDYVEMEMKNKFFDHARNIWERGCYRLPGQEKLWLKYAEMQVRLGNYQNARDIYSSWMTHNPSENAWDVFLKFEERLGEYENCREILKDYIDLNPSLKAYLKAAKFEQKRGSKDKARRYFERAFVELGEIAIDADFIQHFCDFETKCKQYERARVLYKFGLDKLAGTEKAHQLSRKFVEFEKQFGSVENIDEVIFQKRRLHYERELELNPYKYDLWLDLAALEESEYSIKKSQEQLAAVRQVYEKGIGNAPPQGAQKENWKRYIWLWLCYAIFEELREELKEEDSAEKIQRVDEIYKKALEVTPHQQFTISKLWVMYAEFQIRCQNLSQARKILGTAMGKCPTHKIFRDYANLERSMGHLDRCRKIYEKAIEVFGSKGATWPYCEYASFEADLEQFERARAIFEIGLKASVEIRSEDADPEEVWKKYIQFEINNQEFEKARAIYERLIEQSNGHLKVWISFALFAIDHEESMPKARDIFNRGNQHLKGQAKQITADSGIAEYERQEIMRELTESRAMLLQKWHQIEKQKGHDSEWLKIVRKKQPKKIRKRRKLDTGEPEEEKKEEKEGEQGGEEQKDQEDRGWEEFIEYIFPEDAEEEGNEANKRNLKLLEKVRKWKKNKENKD